jgi:outer membrane protein OmpA-like peptidoglycan-associated protein
MKHPARLCRLLAGVWLVALAAPAPVVVAQEAPPAVIDSNTIVRSLKPPSHTATRGLQIEAKTSTDADAGGSGSGKINLDIRFGNDSNKLTEATQTQLAALGHALSSPDLANARFMIAGHTSATGSAEHNQKLSETRARAVRSYLIEHFHIAPARIEATGYGASRPLPNFAPAALQQRRVEIITLPNA